MGGEIGNLFSGGLTKPGLAFPSGDVKMYDSPEARTKAVDAYNAPTQAVGGPTGTINTGALEVSPGVTIPGRDVNVGLEQPKEFKPTFKEAAYDPNGLPRSNNQGLTKFGVLMKVLAGAGQGAAIGSQYRNFGQGMMAANEYPLQQAMQRQAVTHGNLQNQTQQMALDQMQAPVTIGGRTMPFWLANRNLGLAKTQAEVNKDRYVTPRNGGVYDTIRGTYAEGTEPKDKEQNTPDSRKQFVLANPNLFADDNERNQYILYGTREPQPKEANRDDRWMAIRQSEILAANPKFTKDQAYKQAYDEYVQKTKVQPALIRAEGFGETRGPIVTDTQTGITAPMSWNDYNKLSKENPGRFVAPQYDPQTVAQVGTTKAFTTGKPAEELAAFNTAIQHADLLKKAATALGNGDTRTFNSVRNRLKTEFGDPEVTNFQSIADAYTREVNKALTAGHITDSEIKQIGSSMPSNASMAQIMGTLDKYKELMASKVNIRKQQYQQGMKGKPAFGDAPAPTNPYNGGAPRNPYR